MNIIKYYENIGLSDKDLLRLVNNKAKILIYNELLNYKTLDQLLYPYGVIFLLYESQPNWGHWVLIFKRDNKNIEFFDPYGTIIDDELEEIKPSFRKISNQEYPYLTYLFYNSNYDIHYNQYQFQKDGPNIKTCGRWCVVRLYYKDLTLKQFRDLFQNKYSDDIVTYLTAWVHEK